MHVEASSAEGTDSTVTLLSRTADMEEAELQKEEVFSRLITYSLLISAGGNRGRATGSYGQVRNPTKNAGSVNANPRGKGTGSAELLLSVMQDEVHRRLVLVVQVCF